MSTINNTLGALLIGGLVATGVFGISCLQTFNYYLGNKGDSKFLKTFVGSAFLCDVIHEFAIAWGLYWFLITNFENTSAIALIPTPFAAVTYLTIMSNTAIQLFFFQRIWALSKHNYFLAIPLLFLIAGTFGFCLIYSIEGFSARSFARLRDIWWILYIGFSFLLAADFYIAVSLCCLLYKARSGMKRSDSMVYTIMAYAIHTGLLTSFTSTVCLITNIALPRSLTFLAVYLPLSKLYFNAMLGTLNSRQWLRSTYTRPVNNISCLPTCSQGPKRPNPFRLASTNESIGPSDVRVISNAVTNRVAPW